MDIYGYIKDIFKSSLEYIFPFFFKKKATLVFLGLDNAGKSSLMFRLKYGRMGALDPTGDATCETLTLGKVTFVTYDLGGHIQARRVWRDYLPVADGIVFMVDAAEPDTNRMMTSRQELQGILSNEDMQHVPVLVLVNKIDAADAVSPEQIVCEFGLYDLITGKDETNRRRLGGKRPLEVFSCSVLKEQGYGSAFRWLTDLM